MEISFQTSFLFLLCLQYSWCANCGQQQRQFSSAHFRKHGKNISAVISKGNSNLGEINIIGGTQAQLGQWPWQVLIEFSNKQDLGTTCGGTLISAQHVLTAAHCADQLKYKLGQATVYAGIIDSYTKTGAFPLAIVSVTIHNSYDSQSSNQLNDIAVLTLDRALPFGPTVQPICLPEKDSIPPSNGQLWVTGWGAYNQGTSIIRQASEYLQYSAVPNVPLDTCRNLWLNLHNDYNDDFVPSDTQTCAGSRGHGTAEGDSGGPLVIQEQDGTWVQIGITSFGINEGPLYYDQGRAPGIYTRVSAYCDFIKQASDHAATCSSSFPSIYKILIILLLLL